MTDMMRLIEPLIPALRRYARALLRNPTDADDLVQDCLERAVSRWHQRRADGDARTWMFTILHNLAISRFRQTVFPRKPPPAGRRRRRRAWPASLAGGPAEVFRGAGQSLATSGRAA